MDRDASRPSGLPPIRHVVLIIKENRTFDQVLSDVPGADGDTSLQFFPRRSRPTITRSPTRFGTFDRFFTNAEVSAQGHPWSTQAYVTDYIEKTTPRFTRTVVRIRTSRSRSTSRGRLSLDLAKARGLEYRDYGEEAQPAPDVAWRVLRRE